MEQQMEMNRFKSKVLKDKMIRFVSQLPLSTPVNQKSLCRGTNLEYQKHGYASLAKEALTLCWYSRFIGRMPGSSEMMEYIRIDTDAYDRQKGL